MSGTDEQDRDRADRKAATTTTNAYLRKDHRNTMRYRLRRHARPHLFLVGLWTAGAAGHLAGSAAGDVGLAAAGVAATAAAVTVGGWLYARRRGRLTGRRVVGGIAAVGWLGWVTAAGPSWTATTVLTVAGYATSMRYWRRIRIPDPPVDPPPPEGPDPNHPPRLWAQHNGSDGGSLAKSYLTNEEPTSTGLRYDLHLVPGKQTLAKALTVLAVLRTGLLLRPDQDLILEQHPTTDESVVQVTIVRHSPVLAADVTWPGRTYSAERGTVALGPYVDAEGTAEWIVFTANRLQGGFLAGSTGSGKSRILEGLGLGYAQAGCAVWFGDPQGGASSAFLADHADHVARSVDGIRAMLRQAQWVKALRQAENALNRWEGWTPQQDRPGLAIIIDECHRALDDQEIQELATELAREGGKVGIVLILASQVATLDAFGGKAGADALRSSVCSGNLVILRSKTRNTSNVLPGVDVDPTTFPRIPGYGWLIDDTGTRRTAPLRGYYLTDQARDAAGEQVTWPELDPGAAGAAGHGYRDRREQAQLDMAALAEWAAALRQGREPPSSPLLLRPAEVAGTRGAAAPAGPGPKVIPFPIWRTYHQRRAGSSESQPARTAVDAVYQLVAAGLSSPAELQQRTGYSETAVRNALAVLADSGRIQKVRHGVWQPTTGTAAA